MTQQIPETITEEGESSNESVGTEEQEKNDDKATFLSLEGEIIEGENSDIFKTTEDVTESVKSEETEAVLDDISPTDEIQVKKVVKPLDDEKNDEKLVNGILPDKTKFLLYSLQSVKDLGEERKISDRKDLLEIPEIKGEEVISADPEVESPTVESEVESSIDRDAYIELYKSLVTEKTILKRKNLLLQKKLMEYFDKHKMIFKEEVSHSLEEEQKYQKKLYQYEEMRKKEEEEKIAINTELDQKKKECDSLKKELEGEIKLLLDREREIGLELVSSRPGKLITPKTINNLLTQQKKKIEEVNKARFSYIKIRDKLSEKNAAIKELEYIGEGLHLIDYEQLQMEHQNYIEKIDERDQELQKLNVKSSSAIQALAHNKEKSHLTQEKIDALKIELDNLDEKVNQVREIVTSLKKRRDRLQRDTRHLQREAGLLMEEKLLRDFDDSTEKAIHLSAQLQNFKNSYHDTQQKLRAKRKSLSNLAARLASGTSVPSHASSKLSLETFAKGKQQSLHKTSVTFQNKDFNKPYSPTSSEFLYEQGEGLQVTQPKALNNF